MTVRAGKYEEVQSHLLDKFRDAYEREDQARMQAIVEALSQCKVSSSAAEPTRSLAHRSMLARAGGGGLRRALRRMVGGRARARRDARHRGAGSRAPLRRRRAGRVPHARRGARAPHPRHLRHCAPRLRRRALPE